MVVMPRFSASLGPWRWMGRPSQRIRPSSGSQSPEIVLMRTDLPAPLSPQSAVTCPAATSRLTLVSAWTGPKCLEMPWRETSGEASAAAGSGGTTAAVPGESAGT